MHQFPSGRHWPRARWAIHFISLKDGDIPVRGTPPLHPRRRWRQTPRVQGRFRMGSGRLRPARPGTCYTVATAARWRTKAQSCHRTGPACGRPGGGLCLVQLRDGHGRLPPGTPRAALPLRSAAPGLWAGGQSSRGRRASPPPAGPAGRAPFPPPAMSGALPTPARGTAAAG